MLAADWNIRFSAFFSWGTALFQQLWCIANAFFRQILLQGCFMECELLRSPMISYRSLLYNTTVLYDMYIVDHSIPTDYGVIYSYTYKIYSEILWICKMIIILNNINNSDLSSSYLASFTPDICLYAWYILLQLHFIMTAFRVVLI